MHPKILALETSLQACSAALLIDNKIAEHFQFAPKQHSQLILNMVESLLSENQLELKELDAIAFAAGPGGFTGIRIACAVAQGLAFSAELPVISVSTLQALAQGYYREHAATHVLICLDAHMKEVYWGCYELQTNHLMQVLETDKICLPHATHLPNKNFAWTAIGDGWNKYGEILKPQYAQQIASIDAEYQPHAHDVALIAKEKWRAQETMSAENAQPIYLRQSNAWKKIKDQ